MLDFMQGIGGEIDKYKFDIKASKKLNDIQKVLSEVCEMLDSTFAGTSTPEYDRGVKDIAEMIEEIIKK